METIPTIKELTAAFDHATDALFDHVDLGIDYRNRTNHSIFVAEAHVNYLREAVEGENLRFATRILELADKKMRLFHAMYHQDDRALIATTELMMIHMDLDQRRAVPFDEPARSRLARMFSHHDAHPAPLQAGRHVGASRK